MAGRNLDQVVEAVLFASDEALSAERIAAALERQTATPSAIREAVQRLNESYRQSDRSFEIVEVAGGYKMMTLPEYNNYVRRVLRNRSRDRLSQAALETLAVTAYRQPVTRAEIDNIRGVDSGPILRMLVDRGLVRIVGRQEALGHPLLYGTTKLFLELFGLKDLESLPKAEELMKLEAEAEDAEEESSEEGPAGEAEPAAPSEAVASGLAALADDDQDAPTEPPEGLATSDQAPPTTAGQDRPCPDAEDESDSGAAPPPDEGIIRLANHQKPSSDDPNPEENK